MTNVKISGLPTANTIADSTVFLGNVSGVTSQFDATVVKDYIGMVNTITGYRKCVSGSGYHVYKY